MPGRYPNCCPLLPFNSVDSDQDAGGVLCYLALSIARQGVALVGQIVAKLRPASDAPARKTKQAFTLDPKPAKGAAPPKKEPGKSVKQLLKESKLAAAAAHSERIPDSEYFLNSLKGHGDVVLTVDIAPDDSHILTACSDQVRQPRPRYSDCQH